MIKLLGYIASFQLIYTFHNIAKVTIEGLNI